MEDVIGTLKKANAIAVDEHLTFDNPSHTYRFKGQKVRRSVTTLLKISFKEDGKFDADAVIKKNLANWRSNASSQYYELVADKSENDAIKAVKADWELRRDLGELLHKMCEVFLEARAAGQAAPPPAPSVATEFQSFVNLFGDPEQIVAQAALEPFRTELPLIAIRDGHAVVAGTADALFLDSNGDTWLIDFKRTDKDLSPSVFDFGRGGINEMQGKKGNDYNKYSLQLSFYAVMLEESAGITVPPDHRLLVQLHPTLERPNIVKAACFDTQARSIIDRVAFEDAASRPSFAKRQKN